jgi:hypothetical protein
MIFRGTIMVMTQNASIIHVLVAVAAIVVLASPLMVDATGAGTAEPQLAHMVYFKLKDNSGGSRARLVAACKLLLTNHPGTVSFATGTLAGDFTREVNDKNFDVSLHLVFVNKAAHDKYQEDPRHVKFVEENRENWEKVRVFDSYLSPAPAAAASINTAQ